MNEKEQKFSLENKFIKDYFSDLNIKQKIKKMFLPSIYLIVLYLLIAAIQIGILITLNDISIKNIFSNIAIIIASFIFYWIYYQDIINQKININEEDTRLSRAMNENNLTQNIMDKYFIKCLESYLEYKSNSFKQAMNVLLSISIAFGTALILQYITSINTCSNNNVEFAIAGIFILTTGIWLQIIEKPLNFLKINKIKLIINVYNKNQIKNLQNASNKTSNKKNNGKLNNLSNSKRKTKKRKKKATKVNTKKRNVSKSSSTKN